MAVDVTHAVTSNGDMASRPGRAYVEPLRNLSKGLGGSCTPSLGKARYAGVKQSALASRQHTS